MFLSCLRKPLQTLEGKIWNERLSGSCSSNNGSAMTDGVFVGGVNILFFKNLQRGTYLLL